MAAEPAVADKSAAVDAAVATLCGRRLRDDVATMRAAGVKIDDARMLRLLERVYRGEMIDSITAGDAEAIIRNAAETVPSGPLTPMNVEQENAWVASKADLPGAKVLPDGIVLQTLSEGDGDRPQLLNDVLVTYTARLSSGNVFDRTDDGPFTMPMYNIVPGLRKALQQMRVGGTYRVFIPPLQGYGPESVMDVIPANSALDFTIKVLEIKK